MKKTSADLIQDPSIYHGKKSSAIANTSGEVTAFYTGEIESVKEESLGQGAYIASSGNDRKVT